MLNIIMNFDAFSHGQLQSKIWLCEILEPLLPKKTNVGILGGWYNHLGMMMLIRHQKLYKSITNIDIDQSTKEIADKLTDTWIVDKIVTNRIEDCSTSDLSKFDVVINCSVEHMTDDWFKNVTEHTLVCIQSSDMTSIDETWKCSNPNLSIETLKKKYKLSTILFEGSKLFDYQTFAYKRFMLIGIK